MTGCVKGNKSENVIVSQDYPAMSTLFLLVKLHQTDNASSQKTLHQQNKRPHCLSHGEVITQQVHILSPSSLCVCVVQVTSVGCWSCALRRPEKLTDQEF